MALYGRSPCSPTMLNVIVFARTVTAMKPYWSWNEAVLGCVPSDGMSPDF